MNQIKNSMNQIPLPNDLHKRAKQGVAQVRKKKSKKWVALPAASILLAGSLTVGAAINDPLNQLVSLVSPKFAELLQPIEMVTTDKGIKVEVVSAMQDKHSAVIYLAISDLDENRITSNLDMYDFSVSKGSAFNAQTIDYDASTRTAIVRILASNGIEASKLKLSLRSLIGDKTVMNADVPIQLREVTQQRLQPLPDDAIRGVGGSGANTLLLNTLPAGKLNVQVPGYSGMSIKNIGTFDGKLYVQTEWLANNNVDHARFYLIDNENNKIESNYSISYGRDEQGNIEYGYNFNEYVFNLETVDLSRYTLATTIYHYEEQIEGDWQVSFNLDAIESKTVQLNKQIHDWEVTNLELSPLGITLQGKGEFKEDQSIQAKLYMEDGSSKVLSNNILIIDDDTSTVTLYPDQIIDFKTIKSVEINGLLVDL